MSLCWLQCIKSCVFLFVELQTPAPYEGVLYYIDHAINTFGATKLQLDVSVRFVMSPCGLAATNPAVKAQGVFDVMSVVTAVFLWAPDSSFGAVIVNNTLPG